MNIFKWLDSLIRRWDISDEEFTGAILPTEDQLGAIVKFSDIVAKAAPVKWEKLDMTKLPTWVQYNQGRKNKCVGDTKALMDSIKFYVRNNLKREVKFSGDWIYYHRIPKMPGMVGTRAIDITRDIGNVHESIIPDFLTDYDVDSFVPEKWMYEEAKIFRTADDPILPPIKDIETLASIMMVTKKPIMVWFVFQSKEWTAVPYLSGDRPTLAHSVTFIPPRNPGEMTYGIHEGEKAIVIQDSWGLQYGINGKRIIKESFFKERNIFNQYDMNFKFDSSGKPKYDGTIISLQKCLRSAGLFPTNVDFVESFGPLTKSSLLKWKTANGLPADSVLDTKTDNSLRAAFP